MRDKDGFAHNKKIESENIKDKIIKLCDFGEGITTPKMFEMGEIMNLINETGILEKLKNRKLDWKY